MVDRADRADGYVVIGSEESPYSVKVRSYFRYKGIAHDWKDRSQAADLYAKHARLPLVPLVVTPEDTGIQDSTPIIEAMEKAFPQPSIHPPGTVAGFISALIEEFGDEWGNKWMFHMRWAREIDQVSRVPPFCGQGAARSVGGSGKRHSRTHGAESVVRGIQRSHCAANRTEPRRCAGHFESAFGQSSIPVRCATRVRGLRPLGADL